GKCASVRALKPESAGRTAIEIERPLDLKVGRQHGRKDVRKVRQGHVRTKSQSRFVPRSHGGKCAPCGAGCLQPADGFAKIDNHWTGLDCGVRFLRERTFDDSRNLNSLGSVAEYASE